MKFHLYFTCLKGVFICTTTVFPTSKEIPSKERVLFNLYYFMIDNEMTREHCFFQFLFFELVYLHVFPFFQTDGTLKFDLSALWNLTGKIIFYLILSLSIKHCCEVLLTHSRTFSLEETFSLTFLVIPV